MTSTASYTLISFLPLSLYYYFSKWTNFYFLIMTLLLITKWSPFNVSSVIAPMVFITLVTLIREGVEDLSRHRSDR